MDGDTDDATRYRQRAGDLRRIALGIKDKKAREFLLQVAEDYLKMATTRNGIASSDLAREPKGSP